MKLEKRSWVKLLFSQSILLIPYLLQLCLATLKSDGHIWAQIACMADSNSDIIIKRTTNREDRRRF